ncbi:MAG: hypothetical protein K5787_18460 [Lentisphaeria bacterium]|nr:hypothetical protein [Lentisphaeria bacterium]
MDAHQLKVVLFKTFPGKIYKKYRRRYLEGKKINELAGLHHLKVDEKLVQDIYDSMGQYHVSIDEYFKFAFYKQSADERREFVPEEEWYLFCDRMNQEENRRLFNAKVLTYGIYKPFYMREVVGFDYVKGDRINDLVSKYKDEFIAFARKHRTFIVKPMLGSLGAGVVLWTVDETCDDAYLGKLLKSFLKKTGPQGGFVLEERIGQVEEMAKLHPKSVNTLRMTTIRFDDRVEIIHPILKIGRGDSVADNGMAGGILTTLDENGRIKAASDKNGILYSRLNDIGIDLMGWQVPCWREALDFARRLAMVMPSNRYTGWDIALTPGGWCMVEGNARGQFVWQIPDRKGFRTEINNILAELKLSI